MDSPEGIMVYTRISEFSDEKVYPDEEEGDIYYRSAYLIPEAAPDGYMSTVIVQVPSHVIEEYGLEVGQRVLANFVFLPEEQPFGSFDSLP